MSGEQKGRTHSGVAAPMHYSIVHYTYVGWQRGTGFLIVYRAPSLRYGRGGVAGSRSPTPGRGAVVCRGGSGFRVPGVLRDRGHTLSRLT